MVINNSFEFEYFSYDAHNCTVPVELRQMKDKYWDISGAGPHYISTEGGIAPTNPSYLMLCVGGFYRLENPGYAVGGWNNYGMALDEGKTYHFSMWVKPLGFEGTAEVYLRGARGELTTKSEIVLSGDSGTWKKACCSVKATKTEMGRLVILFRGRGRIGVDYISLLPEDVWGDAEKYRNGKLSTRIVQVLKECHPSFCGFLAVALWRVMKYLKISIVGAGQSGRWKSAGRSRIHGDTCNRTGSVFMNIFVCAKI